MPITVRQLADLVRGQLSGDGDVVIQSARALNEAGPGDITFVENNRYASQLHSCRASAVVVGPSLATNGLTVIRVADPLTAFVTAQVIQRELDDVAAALAAIPEVLQVQGMTGPTDLLIHVVAADADDLYRTAGQILAIPGVERTSTALVMRDLVSYRIAPLLRRLAAGAARHQP